MGKTAVASRPRPGSGKSKGPNIGVYVALVVVVGAVAWASLRPAEKRKKAKRQKPASEEQHGEEDELRVIREALFTNEGTPQFGNERYAKEGQDHFASQRFWDERYAKEKKPYDWFGTWNGQSGVRIKHHVEGHLPSGKDGPVLIVGCGSSRLAGELLEDGYTNISNVDISSVVIERMTKQFEGQKGIDFQVMNITDMTYADARFDLVFDKSTLDAMYTGAVHHVRAAVLEIFRVIRPGGVFVSMTFAAPWRRKELNITDGKDHTAPPGWSSFHTARVPKFESLPDPDSEESYYYVYVAKK